MPSAVTNVQIHILLVIYWKIHAKICLYKLAKINSSNLTHEDDLDSHIQA